LAFLLSIIAFVPSCGYKDNTDNNIPPDSDIGKAHVWLTRGDKTNLLSQGPDLSIKETASSNWPFIEIDTTTSLQTIDGFGAALTGSSAYLINRKLGESKRAQVLNSLFNPGLGIGISCLRLTIGASDFSLSDFTYDDMPSGQTDFDLEHFSLSQDTLDVIPVMQEILQINPDIMLIGSPWSPPAWMKTNGSLEGGQLKPECYDVYAGYFVKYIRSMKEHGITIDAVTPQNEPLYFTANYPCMEMQADVQKDFIKEYLGPKFAESGIDSRIIIYDHNWDNTEYAISVLDDPEAAAYIAGSAFHAYAGNVSAMSVVHNAHPVKDLYFTEISGGGWATDFSANLMWYMQNIFIGTVNNWSGMALFWNLALDEASGPQNNGCSNCRGVVTIDQSSGNVVKNEEYYALAHMSKFVRPGAVRIASGADPELSNVYLAAFLNADGSKVLVICNNNGDSKTFTVSQGEKKFSYSLPAKAVATIVW